MQLDPNATGGPIEIDNSLDPQVIDLFTGKRLTGLENALAVGKGLELIPLPDGPWLHLLHQGTPDPELPGLEILDVSTLKRIAQLEKSVTDRTVTFAPDGELAYLVIPGQLS